MMEKSKNLEMPPALKAERNTMKRRKRKKMGQLLLRNHIGELKCSCANFQVILSQQVFQAALK
jgi:hypothetical protein